MTSRLKVALYARVSGKKEDNDNQLTQLREFAARQDWQVVAEYVDTVTGSGKKDRAKFDAMMVAASQRQFDILVFWKLDRLSREGVRKTLRYLEQLDSWGVRWRSFMEPLFDSCGIMRDVVISIMATLAEQERINISDRTKAGLARTRAKGTRLGRKQGEVDMNAVRVRHCRTLNSAVVEKRKPKLSLAPSSQGESCAQKEIPDGTTLLGRLAKIRDPEARLGTRLKDPQERHAVMIYVDSLLKSLQSSSQ